MESTSIFLLALAILAPFILLWLSSRKGAGAGAGAGYDRARLPPGPRGWPVFGNLFSIGTMPHRTVTFMRDRYGPVIWLKLGAVNTMVILSAGAAAEFFKNHDIQFADRKLTELMRVHDYHKGSVALAPYGTYWRLMRKLVTVDMLVTKRLNETAHIRRKCIDDMVRWVEDAASKCTPGHGVSVAQQVFLMSFNLLGNLMLSRDLVDPNSKEATEFFMAMTGLMEWSGLANVVDLFPWLKRFDPQGLKKKMERDLGKALEIASIFVKERLEDADEIRKRDFLDVLMKYEGNGKDEPAKLSVQELNKLILEIFMAGSETTSSTIEWAMTELLLNRESMARAKAELSRVIGPARKVEESDFDQLPYLQAVIKETLRLHPPIPFLVPRRAREDTEFMGYFVPKDTQVFVNAWAIGRDPGMWSDPLEFKPERFLGSRLDYKGQNYEYIPFGSGRRICAGVALAQRMLYLLLASLLHEFDWEFDSRIDPSTIDMRDRLGVTMRKHEPLLAVPKKCNVL